MKLRIRRARRGDFDTLAALAGWPGIGESERRTLRLYRNVVADQAYDLYVAEEDAEAVGIGAVSYVRVLGLGGQRARLEQVSVRSDRRRAGVGRALVEFLWQRAMRRGVRAFEAVPPNDEAAASFLRAVGFEPAGDRVLRPVPETGA